MNQESTITRLRNTIIAITDQLSQLIQAIPIEHLNRSKVHFSIIRPEYYWGEPSPKERNIQIDIKRKYNQWSELLRLILRQAPEDVECKLNQADKSFRIWLELDSSRAVSPDRKKNEISYKKDVAEFFELLKILDVKENHKIIVIPDTNALLISPDPVNYRMPIKEDSFIFLLLPTVLKELDDLKLLHRNPDVRDKAKKMITRIKGWRNQESLLEGAKVDRTITVMAIAKEPKMESSLSWLDKDIADDRLIASILEVMTDYISDRIILVTNDINLQNKADTAFIEYKEPPSA